MVDTAPHRALWRIAGPVMLGNLSVPLVGVVDTAVVGHLSDPRYLATVAFGSASISLVLFMFGFLRMGTGGLIAQAAGAGDKQALGRVTARALLIATALGAAVALSSPWLIDLSVALSGKGESLGALIDAYLLPRFIVAPAALANFVILGVLISLDRAGLALAVQLLLNGCNIALDLLFVNGFGWDVFGVALASAISEVVSCAVGLRLVYLQLQQHGALPSRDDVQHASGWSTLFTVNRDIFIRSLCLVGSFYSLPLIGARLGEVTLAANGVLLNFFLLASYALDGFAHAAEVQCGTAYGAKKQQLMRERVRLGTLWSLTTAALMSFLFAVSGHSVLGLLTSIPDVLATATTYLPWLVLSPLVGALAFQMDGVYFGTTHTATLRNAMIVSCVLYAVLLAICVPVWHNHGLWFAFSTFMLSRGLLLLAQYPTIERAISQNRVH